MSHDLSPIKGQKNLFMDNSSIDDSYFIRTAEYLDKNFNKDWRKYVHKDDVWTLKEAEETMLRNQFSVRPTSGKSVFFCQMCQANLPSRQSALEHMRYKNYQECPPLKGKDLEAKKKRDAIYEKERAKKLAIKGWHPRIQDKDRMMMYDINTPKGEQTAYATVTDYPKRDGTWFFYAGEKHKKDKMTREEAIAYLNKFMADHPEGF